MRKMSALSGRSIDASPEPQFIVPEASVAMLMMTQALAGVVVELGIVRGPPKKQPASVQLRSLPVSVDAVGPIVAVCPVQLVSATTQCRLFGVESGSVMELPPPPTYMPPQPTGAYSLPSTLRMVPQGAPLYPSLMKLEKPKPLFKKLDPEVVVPEELERMRKRSGEDEPPSAHQ